MNGGRDILPGTMSSSDSMSPPPDEPEPGAASPPSRKSGYGWIWPVVKWSLFVVMAVYVGRHAVTLWRDVSSRPDRIAWGWLAPAGLMAIAAWTPSVLYWRRLVWRAGYPVRLSILVHAYWAGHLGKYVPGKAVAIAVRCALLKPEGVPLSVSARTAVQETLVSMSVGLAVLFALFPWLAGVSRWAGQLVSRLGLTGWLAWGWAAGLFAITVVVLYVGKSLLAQVARRVARKSAGDGETVPSERASVNGTFDGREESQPIDEALPAKGMSFLETTAWCLFLMLGWWTHGLALGLVSLAVGDQPLAEMLHRWPVWTAAAAAGTTVGFFVLIAPGGLAVREELVVDLTQPILGGSAAVLLAVLSRLAILAGEVGGLAITAVWHRFDPLSRGGAGSTPPGSPSSRQTLDGRSCRR